MRDATRKAEFQPEAVQRSRLMQAVRQACEVEELLFQSIKCYADVKGVLPHLAPFLQLIHDASIAFCKLPLQICFSLLPVLDTQSPVIPVFSEDCPIARHHRSG